MKRIMMLITGVGLALGVAAAQAQTKTTTMTTTPFRFFGGGYGGTYATSYGPDWATNPIQGLDYGRARVLDAWGQNAKSNAEAAVQYSDAQRRQIENWKEAVDTSFAIQKTYHDARVAARGRPLSSADYIHMAQVGKPQRLTPSQLNLLTGELAWPAVLEDDPFASYRQMLDHLFVERAERGRLAFRDAMRAEHTAVTMTGMLRERISEMPTAEYMAARHFLESLAYESTLTAPDTTGSMSTAALRVTQR